MRKIYMFARLLSRTQLPRGNPRKSAIARIASSVLFTAAILLRSSSFRFAFLSAFARISISST